MVQVGYMWRYSDITDRTKALIGDRRIALIEAQNWVGVPPSPWWGVKATSGGQVVEQSTHLYELVRYFGGEVDEVFAYGAHRVVGDQIDFEDTVTAVMRHENGIVGHVSSTCACVDGRFDLHIVGERFRLFLS